MPDAVFVASAIFNDAASGATVVLPKPAGVVANDILVALAFHNGFADIRWTPPAGFVELEDRGQNPGSNGPNFTYAVKVAGASEPSSYTFTNGESRANRVGIIMAFRNADVVNPVNGHANANDDLTPFTCPSITTTVHGCLIVRMNAVQWSGVPTAGVPTPGGHTKQEEEIAGGEVGVAYTQDLIQAIKGITGTVDIAGAGGGFARGVGITLAIAPIPPTGPQSEPVFESASSFFVLAGAAIALPKPAGLAVGDLMVGLVQKNLAGPTGVWTLPAGWTSLEETDPGGAGPLNPKTLLAEKIADAGDVAASTFTFSHSDVTTPNMNGIILRVRGTAGLASKAITKLPGPNSPISVMICPDLVTTEGIDLIVRVLMFDGTGATDAIIVTPPAGITERAVSRNAAPPPFTSDSMMFAYTDDAKLKVPGPTGTATFAATAFSGDERGIHYTLAFKPSGLTYHGFTKDQTEFSDAKPQSLVIPVQAGAALDDLLVAVIAEGVDRPTRTIPAGWAVVDRAVGIMPMDVEGDEPGGPGGQRQNMMSVFFKLASASEPADYTWSWSDPTFGTGRFGYMLRFSKQDLTQPFDDAQMEGAGLAVPSGPTGLAWRVNGPTVDGGLAFRFGSMFTVATPGITGPAGDTLIDSDISTVGTNGIQIWIAMAADSPIKGRGSFGPAWAAPINDHAVVGCFTIAPARMAGSGLRVETVTRRLDMVQTLSLRFSDLTHPQVIPLTNENDLLLSLGFFNPNITGITIPAGWTNVHTSSPVTNGRGAITIDRRFASAVDA